MSRGDWIPKDMLLAANAFAGISWIAMLTLVLTGAEPGSLRSLAYVHLVGLGWLSLTALSVLIHVVPAFLGVPWIWESVARTALRGLAAAILVLVAGFAAANTTLLQWGGILTFAMLVLYLVPAGVTIAHGLASERREAVIARALLGTLLVLASVAALGMLFGLALNGRADARILLTLPPAHGLLAIGGWLTLLVFGVSTRTMRAITGAGSRWPFAHVSAAALLVLGVLAGALAAIVASPALSVAAISAIGIGVAAYIANLVDVLQRGTVPNRIPQAFAAAAAVWLASTVLLGIGTLAGKAWGAAFVYVALAGWLGQMVNAHVFHIGIRLMTTAIRGDDDETRPGTIVESRLGFSAWAAFQIAVGLGTLGLATYDRVEVGFAAFSGLIGWSAMLVTVLDARRKLRAPAVSDAIDAG